MSIGLAHVFGSKGLITFQYDLTDFSNLKFNVADGDINFINQNNKIERSLKSAGILKLGGEYRVNRLSFRLGYFDQQSINKTINDKSIIKIFRNETAEPATIVNGITENKSKK